MDTKARLLALIEKMFDVTEESIDPQAPLASAKLDSLSVIEFLFAVEDEFKVDLKTSVDHSTSLNQLIAILDGKPVTVPTATVPSATVPSETT